MTPGRIEISLSAMAALLTLLATYAITRVTQSWFYPEPDPSLVIWDTRIGMYWRLGISAYAGAMIAPLALRFARRDARATARALRFYLVVAGGLITLQALLKP